MYKILNLKRVFSTFKKLYGAFLIFFSNLKFWGVYIPYFNDINIICYFNNVTFAIHYFTTN